MDISIQTAPLSGNLKEKLSTVSDLGVSAATVSTYGYYGQAEIEAEKYLNDVEVRDEIQTIQEETGVEIRMVGGGNNPLHPEREAATSSREEIRSTIRLADHLGVDTVSCHAGLPAAAPTDSTPNWITMPIPPESHLVDAYRYQWEEVTVPFWRDTAAFADDHDVDIAIEPHLNTIVHTPDQLLRLRDETNDRIGAKLDPSHLILQGIDVTEAIRYLGEADAIHQFEASDVRRYESNTNLYGTFSMPPAEDRTDRSWEFRAVGRGQGEEYWRDVIDTLDVVEFGGVINVQHLHTPEPVIAGFETAVELLGDLLIDG